MKFALVVLTLTNLLSGYLCILGFQRANRFEDKLYSLQNDAAPSIGIINKEYSRCVHAIFEAGFEVAYNKSIAYYKTADIDNKMLNAYLAIQILHCMRPERAK